MVLSTNQVRNLYVVKSVGAVNAGSTAGTVKTKSVDSDIVFQYMGAGGLTRSDLINKKSIYNVSTRKASDLVRYLKKDTITLDTDYLSGTNVNLTTLPAGTEALIKIVFFEYGAISPEYQYSKVAAATIKPTMTASALYTELTKNLVDNFSTEEIPLIKFGIVGAVGGLTMTTNPRYKFILDVGASNSTPTVTKNGDIVTIKIIAAETKANINTALKTAGITDVNVTDAGTATSVSTAIGITATGIVAEELEQPWTLGLKESKSLMYNISFNTSDIYTTAGGVTRISNIAWGTTVRTNGASIGNGKQIADMEYFLMGERGDIYRGSGFPHTIQTTYLVDPTKQYDVVEFDFAFTDTGVNVQQSVKHITFVCETSATNDIADALIGDINSVSGLTIPVLSE